MPKSDSIDTTDPSAPTTSEMDAMWFATRRAELEAEDLRNYERIRRFAVQTVFGHMDEVA